MKFFFALFLSQSALSVPVQAPLIKGALFLTIAFGSFGEALNTDRASLPLCQPRPDETTQCCGVDFDSAQITCCRFEDLDSEIPIICKSFNPEKFLLRKDYEYLDKAQLLSQANNTRIVMRQKFRSKMCNSLPNCPADDKIFKKGYRFTDTDPLFQHDTEVRLREVIQINNPLLSTMKYFRELIRSLTGLGVSFKVQVVDVATTAAKSYVKWNSKGALKECNIIISLSLLQKVSSYEELADIFAHEIGHIIIFDDPDYKKINKEARERTADYIGALMTNPDSLFASFFYFLKRSGYQTDVDYFESMIKNAQKTCERGKSKLDSTDHLLGPCRLKTLLTLTAKYAKVDHFLTNQLKDEGFNP